MAKPIYKRIVLKISGEALAGEKVHGIDPKVLTSISRQIKEIRDLGVDVANLSVTFFFLVRQTGRVFLMRPLPLHRNLLLG